MPHARTVLNIMHSESATLSMQSHTQSQAHKRALDSAHGEKHTRSNDNCVNSHVVSKLLGMQIMYLQ